MKRCVMFAAILAISMIAFGIDSPAQTFTTLVDFNGFNGEEPYLGPITQGVDGAIYGTTESGGANCTPNDSYGCGSIFRMTSTGQLSAIRLTEAQGYIPISGLLFATNGSAYGTSEFGGPNIHCNGGFNACGTIYQVDPSGLVTVVYDFCGQTECVDGAEPWGPLVEGFDGNFYGTTKAGGAYDVCTVFKITKSGILTTLHSFCPQIPCQDGSEMQSALIQNSDGIFYGATEFGGNAECPDLGCGTIFRITPNGTFTTIHKFNGHDGWDISGLNQGNDGNFYGTTFLGGDLTCDPPRGCGVVFSIAPSGTFHVLHEFELTDGVGPVAGLTWANDGNLYGTTSGYDTYGHRIKSSTIFRISPGGTLTTLYIFTDADGVRPTSSLLQSTTGILYGTTLVGGNLKCNHKEGCGTVFSFDLGLQPFISFVQRFGKVNLLIGILGQGFTGTTSVTLNGTPANFTVVSDTFIKATVPAGATTGYVTVTTPSGTLTSNVPFYVLP